MASPSINIHYVDQESHLVGLHRSGWEYVVKQLGSLHSANGIWCDTFVDRTFLFNTDPQLQKLIPYAVPWIGFIHHPFDRANSSCDSGSLVDSKGFQDSLAACRGIYVFGSEMETNWKAALKKLGYPDLPVRSLVHPTEAVTSAARFSIEAFKQNKTLVQVGAHLRDTYAIFALNRGVSPVGEAQLQKAALVGPQMDAYYIAETFFSYLAHPEPLTTDEPQGQSNPLIEADQQKIYSVNAQLPDVLLDAVESATPPVVADAICRTACRGDIYANRYLVGALKVLKQYDLSVALLPTLEDEAYDELLSRSVVFLQLFPSATTAVNTIIECIVRHTPMVVNRIPSTIELLGEDYPLFFNDIDEVPALLTMQTIEAAHVYLSNDAITAKFSGESFMTAFRSSLAKTS